MFTDPSRFPNVMPLQLMDYLCFIDGINGVGGFVSKLPLLNMKQNILMATLMQPYLTRFKAQQQCPSFKTILVIISVYKYKWFCVIKYLGFI